MKEVKSMKGKSCHRKNCKMENCVKEKHEWKTRNGKTGSGKTVSSAEKLVRDSEKIYTVSSIRSKVCLDATASKRGQRLCLFHSFEHFQHLSPNLYVMVK